MALYITYDQIVNKCYEKINNNLKKITGEKNQKNVLLSGRAESNKSIQSKDSIKQSGRSQNSKNNLDKDLDDMNPDEQNNDKDLIN